MRCLLISVLALASMFTASLPAQAPASIDQGAAAWFADREAQFIELRHDLHRHPELSGAEARTAGIVAERLKRAGLEVTTGYAGHGVVARLRGGKAGPTIAFRADMDAVRSYAPDPVEFASVTPGVRHICGHDVHTTIGVALAASLAAVRSDLAGSIVFIFQPSEETATGADAMLAAGLFDRDPPRSIFAFHTAPLPVGQIATARATLMPARDRLRVSITAAQDQDAMAAELRQAIRQMGTLTPPQVFASMAGDFANIDNTDLRPGNGGATMVSAGVTVSGPAARAAFRQRLAAAIAGLEKRGARVSPSYDESAVAGVTNAPAIVDRAVVVARRVLGDASVRLIETMVPAFSEDFGSFQQRVPGAMFFLGVSNPAKNTVGMPHAPDYVADDRAIAVGVRVMSAILLDALR